MLPSGAAHAACLVLVTLPTLSTSQVWTQMSAACAFCGGHATATRTIFRSSFSPDYHWLRGQSSEPLVCPPSCTSATTTDNSRCFPLLIGNVGSGVGRSSRGFSRNRGRVGECGGGGGDVFVVAARRGGDDDEDDGEDEVNFGPASRKGQKREGDKRNRLTAPWEDIQWSNVPSSSSERGRRGFSGREEEEEWEEEEEEEEELFLEDERPLGRTGGGRSRRDDFRYDEEDAEDDDYGPAEARPRPQAASARDGGPAESSTEWNAGWFRDAQQGKQRGGVGEWIRSLYNVLFWYGGASEDVEQLPAMNFQDLLERFDAFNGGEAPGRLRPIVPPEDLGAEQNYRWRPSRRDSSAAKDAAEGKSRRRRRNRKAEVSNVGVTESRKTGRGRGRQSEWEEELEEDRPLSRNYVVPSWKEDEAFRGKREENKRGGGGDARAVEQLRRKQRQLVDRELALEVDLDKVRDRLSVVDATVELWLRRSAGVLARGGSEADTAVLQAKRRIYGLKNEGRQLDDATLELKRRLEDCHSKLDRILRELGLLGENAVPQVFYEGDEGEVTEKGSSEEEGKQEGDGASPLDAELAVEMDGLGLNAEKREEEAVPVVENTDKSY